MEKVNDTRRHCRVTKWSGESESGDEHIQRVNANKIRRLIMRDGQKLESDL